MTGKIARMRVSVNSNKIALGKGLGVRFFESTAEPRIQSPYIESI
jgi:hypothetical protein